MPTQSLVTRMSRPTGHTVVIHELYDRGGNLLDTWASVTAQWHNGKRVRLIGQCDVDFALQWAAAEAGAIVGQIPIRRQRHYPRAEGRLG